VKSFVRIPQKLIDIIQLIGAKVSVERKHSMSWCFHVYGMWHYMTMWGNPTKKHLAYTHTWSF